MIRDSPKIINIYYLVYVREYIFENLDYFTNNYSLLKGSICFLTKAVEQIKPIKIYSNFKVNKQYVQKDQKYKTGVYCIVNLVNGNIYIGSSVNFALRMTNYLNTTLLKNRKINNMPIIQALLKYGHENCAVLIVEYVDIENLSVRETYYIIHLLPYYNILKKGYSSIGYKQAEARKQMLSELAKIRTHSDKTKALISRALVGDNNPFYNKNHSVESKLIIIEAKSAYPVYIYNSLKILLVIFPSINTLAKLINSNHSTIVNYIKKEILFRGEWYLLNRPLNLTDKPLISNWNSKESNNLISDIIKNSHIKKAIFLYNLNKEFICKFEDVTHAQKELNINHDLIKKYALLNTPYKGYIFSYTRKIN